MVVGAGFRQNSEHRGQAGAGFSIFSNTGAGAGLGLTDFIYTGVGAGFVEMYRGFDRGRGRGQGPGRVLVISATHSIRYIQSNQLILLTA